MPLSAPVLANFYDQLASLQDAGVPLSAALTSLAEERVLGSRSGVLERMRDDLEKGSSLAEAMEAHPRVFGKTHPRALQAAETSGHLVELLRELRDRLEKHWQVRQKILSGLAYPAVVIHLAIFAPQASVLIMDGLGPFLWNTLPIVAALWTTVFLGWAAWRGADRNPAARGLRDRAVASLPFFGSLAERLALGEYFFSLNMLYRAGVPILEALELAEKSTNNTLVQKRAERIRTKVADEQKTLSEAFAEAGKLPSSIQSLLKTGDMTGNIDQTLDRVSTLLRNQNEKDLDRLAAIVPWAIYLIAAGLVAWTVLGFWADYAARLNRF